MSNVSDDTFVGNSVSDPLGQGGAIEQDFGNILTLADDTITGKSRDQRKAGLTMKVEAR